MDDSIPRNEEREPSIGLLRPLGRSAKLLAGVLNPAVFAEFDWATFRRYCWFLGPQSFLLVTAAAIFVSMALTIQVVTEMKNFRAQDWAGAVISIGLLRELGPLIVSLAWACRCSALVSEEALAADFEDDASFAVRFMMPRLIAAVLISLPLGGFGLVMGFSVATVYAPMLGVSSPNDFLESARMVIQMRDINTFFIKLVIINPIIAIFAGCACGRIARQTGVTRALASNAATVAAMTLFIANWLYTSLVFLR